MWNGTNNLTKIHKKILRKRMYIKFSFKQYFEFTFMTVEFNKTMKKNLCLIVLVDYYLNKWATIVIGLGNNSSFA